MRVEVVPAEKRHGLSVARNLSAEEMEEFLSSGWRGGIEDVLPLLIGHSSESWAIVIDDADVAGVFGVMGAGNIWFIVSKDFRRVSIRFIRQCGPYIDNIVKRYGHVWCRFLAKQTKMIRWLKYAGFEIIPDTDGYVRCEKWASRPQ
jgi:hypothetical protein